MNKKGGVFWISVVLVMIALLTFLALNSKGTDDTRIKAQWQINFLKNNYLEAEKVLLEIEIEATKTGKEIVTELAQNGGFKGSSCSKINGVNAWNVGKKWCPPVIEESLTASAKSKFDGYSNFGYKDKFFFAKGSKKTIKSGVGMYTYDTSFEVYLDYSFDEYEDLKQQAFSLVNNCGKNNNLENCLDSSKPNNWYYTTCGKNQFPQNSMKIPFCVNSRGTKYNFGLDFTENFAPFVS